MNILKALMVLVLINSTLSCSSGDGEGGKDLKGNSIYGTWHRYETKGSKTLLVIQSDGFMAHYYYDGQTKEKEISTYMISVNNDNFKITKVIYESKCPGDDVIDVKSIDKALATKASLSLISYDPETNTTREDTFVKATGAQVNSFSAVNERTCI